MFVFSVKSSKIKIIALIVLLVVAVLSMIYITQKDKPAANDGAISLKAGSEEERVAFLSQFGWDVSDEPVEITEIIIPAEFDAQYESYNTIQKNQNLDLSVFSGTRAKRYTYEVLNYPGYEEKSGCIQANIIVYQGKIIGGDVCSVELNGFMHGFEKT